ncbi:TatD family hydrolase [Eisenibacter elegans]|uniref:TatD family hydrolase n=1 Tax=Eisenibacter elegans TaxID=997 RepID=UPI0004192BA4|nr:TatD family hydrolase [Eisenibacter elegans]
MFADSHTHLYLRQFDTDRETVVAQCQEAGVLQLFLPNIDHSSVEPMLEMSTRYPQQCFAMMGLHPCSVDKDVDKALYEVEHWLHKHRELFVAVGEMGTDLYWDKTYFAQQAEAFKVQVNWAKELDLPIVIHCRESFEETMQLLEPLYDERLRGVFHCFTGSVADAERVLALEGFYLGIGGVATFKKSGLDQVLPQLPLERLLLETDSPYLAPVPHRGKRNSPAYIPLIAERIAELKNIPLETVAQQTTANTQALFRTYATHTY